jgi:hypothetical protein
MPRPRREPYIYTRHDRPGTGLWAFISGKQPRVPLHTHDEAEALARLAERLKRSGFQAVAANDLSLSEAATLTVARARAQNTPRTAGEIGLNLARVLEWCQARGVVSVLAVDLPLVEDYKTARRQQLGQRTGKPVGAARVNRELDSWKRLMRTAIEEKKVGSAAALAWFVHLREPRPKPHHVVASRATVDAPKFGRAMSQRPPMPSIVDIEPPAPPTPRGPLGVARVAAMALGSVLGAVSLVLLSSAAHVAGCAWLQRAEPKVVHVVHAIDGVCDAGVEVILPSEARPVCMAADVADGLADRYEAAKEAGATQEIRVETETGEPVAVVPPAEVATVVEQTPARKKRRKRGPRHVDGGTP